MASVHHETALAFLAAQAKAKADGAALRGAIDEAFPGWGRNALPQVGYGDEHHHASLIVSRSLHDTLPAGRSAYAWDYQHGFGAVMGFIDNGAPDARLTAKWLAAAITELEAVMAG